MSEITLPLPCIVCNKKLEHATRLSEGVTPKYNQPGHGLSFVGHGAYGSAFDPMKSNTALVITVCDECLSNKGKEGVVMLMTEPRAVIPTPSYVPYDSDASGWPES